MYDFNMPNKKMLTLINNLFHSFTMYLFTFLHTNIKPINGFRRCALEKYNY